MKIRELLQETTIKAPTPEEQRLIRQYRQQGLSNVEIDKEMGKPKTWTNQVISVHMRDLIRQPQVGLLLTDQDVEDMWKRLQELKNLRAVAQEFGVSEKTVRNRLDDRFGKAEVDKWVPEIIPFTDEDKRAIKNLYASGMGQTSIAARLDPPRPKSSVSEFLRRLPEPEKTELRNQYLANRALLKSQQAATTNIYRAGRIDPTKRGTDWRVGKGYK
jgi:hypothetical protein